MGSSGGGDVNNETNPFANEDNENKPMLANESTSLDTTNPFVNEEKTTSLSTNETKKNQEEEDIFDVNINDSINAQNDNKKPSYSSFKDSTNNNALFCDNEINGDVRIVNTEERKGKITKYTVYIIESSVFGSSTSLARRFNDFKWMQAALGVEFCGCFIPPLPPNNVFERFKDDIISQRRYDLERCLNRINENSILRTSASFESFLCEQSEQVFEEQKKANKKELSERSDYDILSLLLKSFNTLDSEIVPQHLSGFDADNDDLYQLDMPRIREFFMRCDERFVSLCKVCGNLYRIFSHITEELSVFNQELNGLYEAESYDKPKVLAASCNEREDIRGFMAKWKQMSETQMNCYYKHFLLSLRYEQEDVKAILDQFKRYDAVYSKYKKSRAFLKKITEKYPERD